MSNAEWPLSTEAESTKAVVKSLPDVDLDQLEPRDIIVSRQNDFALVYAGNQGTTNLCQSRHACYCTGSGVVRRDARRGSHNDNCDETCECYSLIPKPNCLLGLTGMTYCLRDIGGGEQVWEVGSAPSEPGADGAGDQNEDV